MPKQKIKNQNNADSKTIWSLLLGISDDDWDKLKVDFQNMALQLSKLPQKVEKAVHEITFFLEKKRPEIENIISILEDQQFPDAEVQKRGVSKKEVSGLHWLLPKLVFMKYLKYFGEILIAKTDKQLIPSSKLGIFCYARPKTGHFHGRPCDLSPSTLKFFSKFDLGNSPSR